MSNDNFIDIKRLIASKKPVLAKWLPGFVISYLKRILHQDEINDFIREHKDEKNDDFCVAIMDYFDIQISIQNIHKIPQTGPIIIAMNHPLGGMDAVAFVAGMRNHRKDLKFIVNDLLMNLENLRDLFVGVNKHGKNETSIREQVMNAFEQDDVVCIFPAGLVSRRVNGKIRDLEWKKTFVTYSKKFNQPIIPVHIDGELSNYFYGLSNFRKSMRIKVNFEMLYLSDELFKQRGRHIKFTVGDPIYPESFDQDKSEKEIAQEIKETLYKLEEAR